MVAAAVFSKKVNYILKYFCQVDSVTVTPPSLSLSLSFWVLILRSAPMSRHCKDMTPSATSILIVFPFCFFQIPCMFYFFTWPFQIRFLRVPPLKLTMTRTLICVRDLALRRFCGKSSFHDVMFCFEAATTCTRLAATCADVFKLSNVSFWGRYWKETLSKRLQEGYAKVVLVGDATVGKTHLLSRYVKGAFAAFCLLVFI